MTEKQQIAKEFRRKWFERNDGSMDIINMNRVFYGEPETPFSRIPSFKSNNRNKQ